MEKEGNGTMTQRAGISQGLPAVLSAISPAKAGGLGRTATAAVSIQIQQLECNRREPGTQMKSSGTGANRGNGDSLVEAAAARLRRPSNAIFRHLARIFHASWVARATRPSRRATGPAEGRVPLLAEVLPHNYSPSVPFPVGESPTGTGPDGIGIPPTQSGAGYEITVRRGSVPIQELEIESRSVSFCLMNKFSASDVLQLPVAERLQLVSDIWDSIADAPEALELTSEDKKLIDERLAARRKNPGAGSPWREVYDRITSKKK